MKKQDELEIDDYTKRKKLTIYGWLGIPMFLLASMIASFIMIIGWAVIQAFGGPALITMDSSGTPVLADMTNLMLVSTSFGMLAYPLIWLFPAMRRQNRFVGGYGIKTIDKRMNTSSKAMGWLKAIGIGILLGLLTVIIMTILQIIASPVLSGHNQDDTTTGMIVNAFTGLTNGTSRYAPQAILMIISAFLIGPICEELLFRGEIGMSFRDSTMFRKMGEKPRKIAVCILSGLLFGILHFQTGSDMVVSLLTMLFTSLIGVFFSWLALYKFNSVVPTMAAHVTYNSFAVVASVLLGV